MVGFIMSALAQIGLPLVIKILAGLGIGIAVYSGADFAISEAQTYVNTQIGGLPADMYQLMMLAGLDTGLQIVFAAFTARIAIMSSIGAFTKFKVG